jgi:hypothetical protein
MMSRDQRADQAAEGIADEMIWALSMPTASMKATTALAADAIGLPSAGSLPP